jgi:uncharacterized protein (DUF1499 family)
MWNKWLILVLIVLLAPVIGLALLSLFSRRPTDLGVKDGRLAPCPSSPNCVSTQAEDPGHHIDPIPFTGSAADARALLNKALTSLPRTQVITETEDYLHVECTSLIFRFVDDVEFWIDVPNQLIHFRSASRVGRSDLGVNRARMETVRQKMRDEG